MTLCDTCQSLMISIVHPLHKGHSGRHLHSRVHEGHPFNEGIMGRVTTLQRKSHRRSPFLEGIMRSVTPFKEGIAEGQYPSGRVWEGTFLQISFLKGVRFS